MSGNNGATNVKGGIGSVKDTIGAKDSTQSAAPADTTPADASEATFFRTLSQYQSSYKCMVEEMLKSGGDGNTDQGVIDAERKRMDRYEQQLQGLTHEMTNSILSNSQVTGKLRDELEASRAKLAAMKKTTHAGSANASGSANAAAGGDKKSAKNLANYQGQMATSGAVARLYYTRLIFWAMLAIMLIIVIIHAANSANTGFLINTVGVVVCLVVMYYVLRFVYSKVF